MPSSTGNSFWIGTADGSTTVYAVPFPYLSQADVLVQVNGITMLTPGDYVFLNAGSIKFNVVVPKDATISIARQTSPSKKLVNFNAGAVLTSADLNTATVQSFFRTQEIQDKLDAYILQGVSRYSITGANPFVTPLELIAAAADAILQTQLAQDLQQRITDIDNNAQDILGQSTRVDLLQNTIDQINSSIPGGIGSFLQNEQNARINGDQALASDIELIGAKNGPGTAFILNSSNVYVDPTTSLSDKLTAIASQIGANQAAITNEATTRATADSAAAQITTQLSSTVGSNTAAIQTQQTTINGLSAQYTVKVDVNGHVAGFGLATTQNNGQTVSDFIVLANRFSVIDPGNGSAAPIVPFTIQNGVCFMQNVVISGALIGDASITSAKIGTAQIGTANIANAAITNAKLGNAVVQTANIADATITGAKIASATITNANIANAAIGSAQIGDLAVQNAHIANLVVSTGKVADNAITANAIVTGSSGVSFIFQSQGGVIVIQGTVDINPIGTDGTGDGVVVLVDGVVQDRTIDVAFQTRVPVMAVLHPGAGPHSINVGSTLGTSTKVVVTEYKK